MTDIAGERARLAAQGLEITYRETWGAVQDYTSARTVNRPAQWLFLHITVTQDPADTPAAEAAACRFVEEIGQDRFGIGWSYNGGVMQSGRLYEGQPLTRRGAHTVNDKPNPNFPTGSLNYDARALALVQNIQDAVTDVQIDSAARWGAALRRSGEAIANADWYGHRDVTAKSCPGDIAYRRLGELNALTDYYTQYGLEATLSAKEVEDICKHVTAETDRGIAKTWATLPFFAYDKQRAEELGEDIVWLVSRDGSMTKRWVPQPGDTAEEQEFPGKSILFDLLNDPAAQKPNPVCDGTWPNGYPKPYNRPKKWLDLYTTDGPVPDGWE